MAKYSVDSKGNVTVSGTTIGQAKAAGYQSVTAFEQAVNTGQAPPTVPIQTGTRLSTGGSVYVSPSTGSTTVVQSTPSGSVSYNPQTQTYTNEAGKTEQLSSEQASQKIVAAVSAPRLITNESVTQRPMLISSEQSTSIQSSAQSGLNVRKPKLYGLTTPNTDFLYNKLTNSNAIQKKQAVAQSKDYLNKQGYVINKEPIEYKTGRVAAIYYDSKSIEYQPTYSPWIGNKDIRPDTLIHETAHATQLNVDEPLLLQIMGYPSVKKSLSFVKTRNQAYLAEEAKAFYIQHYYDGRVPRNELVNQFESKIGLTNTNLKVSTNESTFKTKIPQSIRELASSSSNKPTYSNSPDLAMSISPDIRTKEEKLQASRQILAGQLETSAFAASLLFPPSLVLGAAGKAPTLLSTSAVIGTETGLIGALQPVAQTGKIEPVEIVKGGAIGAVAGFGTSFVGGTLINKASSLQLKTPLVLNIGEKGFVNVAGKSSKETAEQALKTKLLSMPAGERALYHPTTKEIAIMETSNDIRLAKDVAASTTPQSTLELIKQVKIPLIDKVFPSLGEKGAINFSGGLGSRYSGGIVSESIGLAKQAAPKITSNKFFLPLATLGFGLAAPEASVAISKTTTKKPARYDAEQLESPGFTTGGIESVYREVETIKTFGKEGGLQIKETQKVYEPRPEVWGINVPMFGRLTAYSAVPSVVVDVFTGGAYQKGFKKGVKEKALGLGYSEVEAQQAADYAYATQGQARSIGETVGIIPIAITGEGLAQGLIKPGAQKLSSYIIPLGVGGAVEGAGFGYLSSQAQTGKIEPISIALGAGLGAGSAVGFGLPIVKWTQQAAIEKTVINTGTQTIAKKGFISAGTKATVGKGVLYAADWTEAFGDKGFAVGAKALGIRAVSTGTRVAVPTFTPSLTPIPTTTTNYMPTSAFTPTTTSTSIFTPTTTSTTTFNPTPTQTNIYNITPSTTFTPLETPTQTNTNTITPTLTTTPTQTSTFTPTFSPNLPILPFFGMPSGEISSGSSKKKKTKYYNELSSALGAFHSLDFGAKRTKRKRRTINIAGEMYYLGKKVKKAKRK